MSVPRPSIRAWYMLELSRAPALVPDIPAQS